MIFEKNKEFGGLRLKIWFLMEFLSILDKKIIL